ncbi:MAG: hypothetical protein IJM17_09615 [Firmicutes bacterium]|nr:hypothetical protein [Bacillota bacterium]
MLKKVFRVIFSLCGMLFGYGVSTLLVDEVSPAIGISLSGVEVMVLESIVTALSGIIFFSYFGTLHRRGEQVAKSLENSLSKIPVGQMVTGGVGMIFGLFAAYLISQIINGIKVLQTAYINVILSVLLYFGLGYLGLYIGRRISLENIREVLSSGGSGLRDAARSRNRQNGASPKIFDTSVIIDGRIYDILKTGFIEGDIVIPEFVLIELRHISDSSDSLKRARGRRGLDILNKIQTDYGIEIYNTEEDKVLAEIPEVDVKLLKLAQNLKGMVVTNDFNLNKVAGIHGVGVLNINELANTLKPVVLPGEDMQVFVVKEGKEPTQGIGYLEDGTMIVVEGGRRFIGKTINSTVTSVLQTSAGRMIFTKPKGV